jgi:hypothetical protein
MSNVRRVFRLREKSNLHEEAVQSRCDELIVRVLRAQVRDLSSHLNEVEPVIVGHIRQMKLAPLCRINEAVAPNILARRLRHGDPERGNVRCREVSAPQSPCNRRRGLSLMSPREVKTGTSASKLCTPYPATSRQIAGDQVVVDF